MSDNTVRAHRFATAMVGKARALLHGLGPRATIACAYVAIGILTFGHVAAAPRHCADAHSDTLIQCRSIHHVLAGLGAGVMWPLYWSWEVQS